MCWNPEADTILWLKLVGSWPVQEALLGGGGGGFMGVIRVRDTRGEGKRKTTPSDTLLFAGFIWRPKIFVG